MKSLLFVNSEGFKVRYFDEYFKETPKERVM